MVPTRFDARIATFLFKEATVPMIWTRRTFDFSRCRGCKHSRGAFTLIELLIVIAIILILIAIALPNFLEAQIRARVTKAKGEIRSLGIALESYRLDWKFYPGRSLPDYRTPYRTRAQVGLAWLTSPIKYMTSLPDDPFALGIDAHDGGGTEVPGPFSYSLTGVDTIYGGDQQLSHPHGGGTLRMWFLMSAGPDRPRTHVNPYTGCPVCCNAINSYSPTNGTSSVGDIFMFGGERVWMGLMDVPVSDCIGRRDKLHTWKQNPGNGVVVDGRTYVSTFPPSSI